jgi:hypothetical protein
MYKKCDYCRSKAETDRPKPSTSAVAVITKVVENPGIEPLLEKAHIDVTPLAQLRELNAEVEVAKKRKSASLPDLVQRRDTTRDVAAQLLADEYKINAETVKTFLAE